LKAKEYGPLSRLQRQMQGTLGKDHSSRTMA